MSTPPRALEPTGRRWVGVAAYHLVVLRRVWRGMVFSRIGGPLLTLFAIGWGVGALVDRGPSRGLPWQGQLLPYVVFVVPGILASQAMLTGFGESSWPVLAGIKWAGTYLAMLATPLRTRDILRGHVAQVGWQLAAGAALFVALAAPFGVWRSWWVMAAVPVAVLTGLGFTLPMAALAAYAQSEAWFTLVFRVGVTPLMLFSGTYFPLEQLPGALRPVAWATPLWHGVEACRALATGVLDAGPLAAHLAVLVGFVVVGWWLADSVLRRRLVT